MIPTLTGFVKQGLQAMGHYRRALAHTALPGVAVLCYHGVRDDDMAPGTIPFQYLHIPASTFESHCRVIRECCDPISLDDWRAAIVADRLEALLDESGERGNHGAVQCRAA